jgi:hypothetical protein
MKISKLFASAAVVAAILTSSSAFAAVYMGSNSAFSYTANDVNGLYGSPIVESTGLSFVPTGFVATSTNGNAAVTTGLLQLQFSTTSGQPGILGVNLTESGDYSINDGGDVKEFAYYSVRVLDANYPGTKTFNVYSTPGFSTDTRPTGADASGPWTDALTLALPFPAQSIIVQLNNNLHAGSNAGGSAVIQKKNIDGGTTPGINLIIPEPTTLTAMVGSIGFAAFRRRKA